MQKQAILQLAGKLQALNAHLDPPFHVKQHVLKMAVNRILLNAREGWFRLDGVVRGEYAIENSSVSGNTRTL